MFKTIVIGLFVLVTVFAVVIFSWGVSLNNEEVGLRNLIEAKQEDNKQQLAGMKNKFREVAQVTDKEAEMLTDIFVKHAEARSTKGGSLATFVTEAVPTVTPQTLMNLQNILSSGRDSWVSRQQELLDLNRTHKTLIKKFPNVILFSILGREEIKIVIVTSSEAEESFKTSKEEAVNLFN